CLQRGPVDGIALMEIDGTHGLAVQTRVEQPLRILQLGALWKRQPHRVLEGLADADDAVVRPDGHPLGAGGLLPLHLFDYGRIGAPDESPQLAQPLTPPASRPADYVIYLLGRGCVANPPGLYVPLRQRSPWSASIAHRSVDAVEGRLEVGAAPGARLMGDLVRDDVGQRAKIVLSSRYLISPPTWRERYTRRSSAGWRVWIRRSASNSAGASCIMGWGSPRDGGGR